MISRIFVVDDQSIIATTTATILQNSGYDAQSFVNPLEAIEAARAIAPDLVISDVMMPQLSGINLVLRLREVCPTCKFILFSGQIKTTELLEAARHDGHDFTVLAKPVHPEELLARIEEMAATA